MSDVLTIGCEHEWADVDRRALLPTHFGEWSDADYSIVNSDGHANHPTGAGHRWGGEINTRPTDTPEGQGEIVAGLAKHFADSGRPAVVNWKSNLHVHVRPASLGSLMGDATRLRAIARRMRAAERLVYSRVEPIVRPEPSEFQNWFGTVLGEPVEYTADEAYKGALRRWRRRLVSHQYSLPDSRWSELQAATTPQQFLDAHSAISSTTGRRVWHLAPRPGMNMRSLFKHGTIEFRHFPGTLSPESVTDCARWCVELVRIVTDEESFAANAERYDATVDDAEAVEAMHVRERVLELLESRSEWRFPKFEPYVHWQWIGFDRTKHS